MDYDIYEAFEAIENELIESQMRNFRRHRAEEDKEGYKWSQWQGEQLKSLEKYRRNNAKKFGSKFSSINFKVADMLKKARDDGNAEQEVAILEAIQKGFKVPDIVPDSMTGEFFKLNDRKLDALIKATVSDLEQAETAILRRADDQYRKAIFNAQVYANTGAGTYEKAVDMACRDMLRAGLACVEYKNGAIHQLSDYAEMAIRTANKRAYLYGEGEKRKEFGITTVVVNSRQGGCSQCAKYIGKIFIDDVYSGGKKSDGNYPLLSDAIKGGLFHPRCKDSTSTYYEGITTLQKVSAEEMAEMDRREKLEEQQSYCKNQAKKNQRIAEHSLDKDNQRTFQKRADAYSKKADEIGGKIAESLEKSDDGGIIRASKKNSELGIFKKRILNDENIEQEYYTVIKDRFSHGSDFAKEAFNKFVPEDSVAEYSYQGVPCYNTTKKKIYMNCNQDKINPRGNGVTWFHEHGHLIDDYAGQISQNEVFSNLLNNDYMQYIFSYSKRYNLKTFDKVQKAISRDLSSMREHSAVSDILHGLSKGSIQGVAKHDLKYWEQRGNLESEVFAHMFECQFDEARYREMKKYFPKALEKFEQILKEVL